MGAVSDYKNRGTGMRESPWTATALAARICLTKALDENPEPVTRERAAIKLELLQITAGVEDGSIKPLDATIRFEQLLNQAQRTH